MKVSLKLKNFWALVICTKEATFILIYHLEQALRVRIIIRDKETMWLPMTVKW